MEKIRVGFLFSLTGTTSVTEIGQYQAALHAIQQFDLIPEVSDICSDPEKTYKHALEMARSGIKIFIGCYTSACRKAILPVLEEYDCLLVYPALYEGQEMHPNVLYLGETPNQQIRTLLQYMGKKKIYLVGNDYVYPRFTNQQIRDLVNEFGGQVVAEHYVPLGETFFQPVIEQIQSISPDVIISTLVGQSMQYFYQCYYESGIVPEQIPIFSPTTTEIEIRSMGSKYAAGHYSCSGYFQSLANPENEKFVQGMIADYGEDTVVSSTMANTYMGVTIILNAIVQLGVIDRKVILHFLYNKTFKTPSGDVKVESNHHLTREVRIGQAGIDGQFKIIWDSEKVILPKPLMANTILESTIDDEQAWQEIVKRIGGEFSKEIVVLNKDNVVLYAESIPQIRRGDTLEEEELEIATRALDEFRLFFGRKPNKPASSQEKFLLGKIVTHNPAFKKELHVAKIASNSDVNVLILGETGTGKEVMARTIHELSHRKNGPFIALNAGAIPKDLISSELFGFVEGAFTGSRRGGSPGKFEAANGGTLFLDEIGEMALELQVSLLRVLEERKVVRIGDHREREVDVRIIAATSRNLKEEIAYQGSFRSDLYYRLNVFSIKLPPLRQRIEDIKGLAMQFLNDFLRHYGSGPTGIDDQVFTVFQEYSWPGNIRELRNVMERAFLLAIQHSHILIDHLPNELHFSRTTREDPVSIAVNLRGIVNETIKQALSETSSISEAAKRLGITRSTLYRKMKKLGANLHTK